MTVDLSSYSSIASGLFVKISILPSTTWLFSDWNGTVVIAGNSYTGVGRLLNITPSESELRPSNSGVTITLSGIPNSSISEVLNAKVKGASVEIRRGVFNATTGVLLPISGNPVGRFFGTITNFGLQEEYDIDQRTATNTIILECAGKVEVLQNKIAGRRTNPNDQKKFYPSDIAMDRVPGLIKSIIDFGSPT